MTITTPAPAAISLPQLKRETINVRIVGTAPLITHQWSEKARRMMLDAQQGRKNPKTAKDPHQDYLDAAYRFDGADRDVMEVDDTHGVPTMAIKSATVKGGGRAFGKSVKMTELRQSLTFIPDGYGSDGIMLSRLEFGNVRMREDLVRVGMGTADLRYRPEYTDWSVIVHVEFMPNVIDIGSVISLIDAGGANGIGEWRPENNGSFGTYRVES